MSYRPRHFYLKNNINNLQNPNYLIWAFPDVIPAPKPSIFLCPLKSRKKNGSVWFFDISTDFLAMCIAFPSMQGIPAFILAVFCFPVCLTVSLQVIYWFPFTIALALDHNSKLLQTINASLPAGVEHHRSATQNLFLIMF